ncbi:MAG: hypothetical protein ACK5RS_05420, partial [Acidobacteriota bacterium]
MKSDKPESGLDRRSLLKSAVAASVGLAGAENAVAAPVDTDSALPSPSLQSPRRTTVREKVIITRLETFLVKPRWLFLKIHTDAGVVGLGEPVTEGRARTCAEAIREIEPYL